ncbi:MAG: pyruvate dehydrogenase (acetyl-transferring) E1 component subunit alpha [Flavobacteriales bacterium]|nr:pyruvate dehydrogenase (acetyl-transferring) E1 component subunit alpha [Flavobacteriales bacterium]
MATKTTSSKSKSTSAQKKKSKFDKDTYLNWYESMLLMRRFEEKCGQLYTMQKFGGFCHLYIGQEAVLAGMVSAMEKEDRVITAYRDHAHPIALGTDPKYVMAELFGKTTGLSKGKGGSMHMFDKERNLFGGHGIVGAQIALGAGIAFADQYREEKHVTYTYMGDGAVRQGILHETFNMAMTWKLPVVFVIENNNYAMGTSVKRSSNVQDLSQLGANYDMPALSVDGMSCEEVHEGFAKAAEHARKGDGPFLLEMRTYRYKGHSMSDPAKYRTKEEVESYKDKDPITIVKEQILKEKWMSEEELKEMDKKIKKQVQECVDFAEESPSPEPSELYEDVYYQEDYPYVKY